MKITFPFKNDFKIWLEEFQEFTEGSANSYLSYVSKFNKLISASSNNKKLELFSVLKSDFENNKYNSIKELIEYLLKESSRKDAAFFFDVSIKELRKYKSGLRKYLDFLNNEIADEDKSSRNENIQYFNNQGRPFTENKSDFIFSKAELRSIFLSRLTTQDRVYDNIFYPIRFINYLFSLRKERKAFLEWAEDLIYSTSIHLEGSTISFQDINSLRISISDHKVYVTVKNKPGEEIVYTRLPNNEQEIFRVSEIRELQLDHITSLESILNGSQKVNYPIISIITNELKSNHINASTNAGKLKELKDLSKLNLLGKSKELSEFIKTIDIQKLRRELDLISSKTGGFQLMYETHNIRKGKK